MSAYSGYRRPPPYEYLWLIEKQKKQSAGLHTIPPPPVLLHGTWIVSRAANSSVVLQVGKMQVKGFFTQTFDTS